MSKSLKFIRFVIFLVVSSLLLTGCLKSKSYEPEDDEETDHTSRTFAITDMHPYPGSGYNIPDKLVGDTYSAYIYIVNNGEHVKEMDARDVKLTIIDETHSRTYEVGTTTIDGNVGYAVFNNLTPAKAAQVHLHVEGYIYQNKNKEIYAAANSNQFNIGAVPPAPEPSNRLIWEQEIVDE